MKGCLTLPHRKRIRIINSHTTHPIAVFIEFWRPFTNFFATIPATANTTGARITIPPGHSAIILKDAVPRKSIFFQVVRPATSAIKGPYFVKSLRRNSTETITF
jgi:hypothetical protein